MNDYKELIDNLKYLSDTVRYPIVNELHAGSLMEDAADAIEQLVSDYEILAKMYAKVNEDLCVRTKERDAVVADVAEQRVCNICKHSKTHIDDEPCNSCLVLRKDGNQTNFDWRGV